MHDLKHLTKKSRLKTLTTPFVRKSSARNSFKTLCETKKQKKRLHIVLPLIALVLVLYPLLSRVAPHIPDSLSFGKLFKLSSTKPREGEVYSSFKIASELLDESRNTGSQLVATTENGHSILFTIDPLLQQSVQDVMVANEVPYGVFVAIEPKTGKVLALTGYSSLNPQWSMDSYFRLYPMASLFKIITASAALEQNKISPDTGCEFSGYSYSENPKHWSVRLGGGGQQMSLSLAMGKSINPVFGSIASQVVGKDSIMSYAQRFGFNQTLFPGTSITPSRAAVPKDESELKLMGAGLGREVKISPLHAAVIMAAIANQGTMMAPILTQEIRDKDNGIVLSEQPVKIRKLVTEQTAAQLSEMLESTITKGTSRKAFYDRRGRPKLASVRIAAKTGSINGTDPAGFYSWFAAYAPVEDPKIALVALIINQDKWKIKASHLGEVALEQFFSSEKRQTMRQDAEKRLRLRSNRAHSISSGYQSNT